MEWEEKEEEGRGLPKYVYEFGGESEWCVEVGGGCNGGSRSSDRRPQYQCGMTSSGVQDTGKF